MTDKAWKRPASWDAKPWRPAKNHRPPWRESPNERQNRLTRELVDSSKESMKPTDMGTEGPLRWLGFNEESLWFLNRTSNTERAEAYQMGIRNLMEEGDSIGEWLTVESANERPHVGFIDLDLCVVPYCDKTVIPEYVWCKRHYKAWLRGGSLRWTIPELVDLYCPRNHEMNRWNSYLSQGRWRCRTCTADARHIRRSAVKAGDYISIEDLGHRDHWTCGLCNFPVDWTLVYPHHGSPTKDHTIPVSQGGLHTWGNVKLAHAWCNWSKNNGTSENISEKYGIYLLTNGT